MLGFEVTHARMVRTSHRIIDRDPTATSSTTTVHIRTSIHTRVKRALAALRRTAPIAPKTMVLHIHVAFARILRDEVEFVAGKS